MVQQLFKLGYTFQGYKGRKQNAINSMDTCDIKWYPSTCKAFVKPCSIFLGRTSVEHGTSVTLQVNLCVKRVIMILLKLTMRMMLTMAITATAMIDIPLVLCSLMHFQVLLSWVQFVIPIEVAVLMRIMDSVLLSPSLMSLAMCEYCFCEMFCFINVLYATLFVVLLCSTMIVMNF